MTLSDFACLVPKGFRREDTATAIPKIVVSLGEITAKAGDSAVFGPLGLTTTKYMLLHILSVHLDSPTMSDLQKKVINGAGVEGGRTTGLPPTGEPGNPANLNAPTMTDLRKEMLRSPANLTKLVDDLEASGWIRRVPSPTDRRVKLIVLTDAGQAKVDEAEKALFDRMQQFFQDYSDEDILALFNLLVRFGNEMLQVLGLEGDYGAPVL